MADLIVVHCTTSSVEEAEAIAAILLDAKLAACVQICPVVSYYVWQGKRTRDSEQLMLIKTRVELFDSICECIRATHAYETPEITSVPLLGVDPAYRAWVEESTARSQ